MNEVKFKANIKDVLALQAEVAAIPEIPTPETTDEGKVLTVAVDSSGETPVVSYELETPSGGLPAISAGDAGKVLTVNDGETGVEWGSAGCEKYMVHVQLLTGAQGVIGCNLLDDIGTPVSADDLYDVSQSGKILTLAYPYIGRLEVGIEDDTCWAELACFTLTHEDTPSPGSLEYTLITTYYEGASTAPVEGYVTIDLVPLTSTNTYTLGSNE